MLSSCQDFLNEIRGMSGRAVRQREIDRKTMLLVKGQRLPVQRISGNPAQTPPQTFRLQQFEQVFAVTLPAQRIRKPQIAQIEPVPEGVTCQPAQNLPVF